MTTGRKRPSLKEKIQAVANKDDKRVLMVAFHYPPDLSSSGVLRTLKFTRYLPECGWNPVVLTVREHHYESTDAKLLQQIPREVQIRRTRAIDTKRILSIRGRYLKITTLPDRFIGWLPFAVREGLRAIRQERIKAIWSTSPLATSHLVAWSLKKLTGLPWVADFRDPWTEPEIASNPRAPLFRLECYLEEQVVRRADRIVLTTSRLREELLGRHPKAAPEKAVVIPNGYDEEDFLTVNGQPDRGSPVRITHSGLVDELYRSPRSFLKAIAQLMSRGALKHGDVRVDFLGGGNYVQSPAFRSLVAEFGLEKEVHVLPRVGYAASLEHQAQSHLLLLLQCGDDTRTLIPAKAFEYLRIGRPILALVPPSASAELFERVRGAKVVHPNDEEGIQGAILELVGAAREGRWESDVDRLALGEYSRRQLTGKLAQVFDSVVSGRGKARAGSL